MNFSQLHCFVALADTESFTETAYTTHLTQSAVSHALSALERGLKLHGAILGAIIRDLDAAGRLQVIQSAPWIGIDLQWRESIVRPTHRVDLALLRVHEVLGFIPE